MPQIALLSLAALLFCAPAPADPSHDVFLTDPVAVLELDRAALERAPNEEAARLALRGFRSASMRWHPDRLHVTGNWQTDRQMKDWIDRAVAVAKEKARARRVRFDREVATEAAVQALASKAFQKVAEAKRAVDLWLQHGRVGAPRIARDPLLDADELRRPGEPSRETGADEERAAHWTPPGGAADMGADFDYLRNGHSGMRWRPREEILRRFTAPDGGILRCTALFDPVTRSWFELATGTTYVWNDFYDGYVNFELGMYYIPATDSEENYIHDPRGHRDFSTHLNGWWDQPRDRNRKIVPRLPAGALGDWMGTAAIAGAGPIRRFLLEAPGASSGARAIAPAAPAGPPAVPARNRPYVREYQEQRLAAGAAPLPMNDEGIVFGFCEGGPGAGFGGLSQDPPTHGPIAMHRQGAIIEAGLRYVATLAPEKRAGKLKYLEALLRHLDTGSSGIRTEQEVAHFLGVQDFLILVPSCPAELETERPPTPRLQSRGT